MSKEYQKKGAKQHKGGGKRKVGPKPGNAPQKDMMNAGGMGYGMQNVVTQSGSPPPGSLPPNTPGGAYGAQ